MQVSLRDIEILAIVWCYRIQLLLTGRRNRIKSCPLQNTIIVEASFIIKSQGFRFIS